MGTLSLTEAKIYDGKKTVSSISGVGKLDSYLKLEDSLTWYTKKEQKQNFKMD